MLGKPKGVETVQYVQIIPVLLCIAYLVFVWLRVIRAEPAPTTRQQRESMYFEEARGTRDPAGLWREMDSGQKRIVQRALVVALLMVAASYAFWFLPSTAPDWVWERAEAIEHPGWFEMKSAASYASPTQWRVIFTGQLREGVSAEIVYTYNRFTGQDHQIVSAGSVGAHDFRLVIGAILLIVSALGVWSTVREASASSRDAR